jgi:hypothetical protein
MSVALPRGPSKRLWQYHSRSDQHSKVACWTVLFDLLQHSNVLRSHAASGKVIFGVNVTMRDFDSGRKKDLDLVVARPAKDSGTKSRNLSTLGTYFGVILEGATAQRLAALPTIGEGRVGAPLLALEAKATMTAHIKALPRLYDELNSSHLTVHGASASTLAVGFSMVNAAQTFVSPDQNKTGFPTVIAVHNQPAVTAAVVAKIREIPRRSGTRTQGFDGLCVVVVDCANDGTPVTIVTDPPAPQPGDVLHYDSMINRVAAEYDTTFAGI